MNRKLLSLVLAVFLLASVFAGCDTISNVADSVMAAARTELENQIKSIFEKNKVDVIEMKTAAGKLNDDGGELQFYAAALIQAESDAVAQTCAGALDNLFEEAKVAVQTGSKIESPYLVHKELSFDFAEFDSGKTYYIVYVYSSDISINLPEFTFPTEG